MEYQALYRKYRPKTLNEVYGQNIVVNILKNAIEMQKFGHAYLFTGSRGCGKTSVAKIVARMINCENNKDGRICGKCKYCIESEKNNCVDILEIDAASNNGVDEIRELKSKVNLVPSTLKYKVYIIDEVHMLSIGAFNALLKTLEEPPQHAIFILATTELDKVPITIVSRCQTLEFKKINNNDMFNRLKEIAQLEKIKITDEAINEIINVSDGGLRDAVGMLDMAHSYTKDEITEDDILLINGNVSNEEIEYLSELILKKNIKMVINQINEFFNKGKDLVKITEKIIINITEKMIKNNDTNICLVVKKMSDAVEKMKNSTIGKIYLELALFELSENNIEKGEIQPNEEVKKNIEEINSNIEEREEKKEISIVNNAENRKRISKIDDNFKNIRINNTFVDADKKFLNKIKEEWERLKEYTFDKEFGAIVCELLDATPVAASSKNLILTYNYDSFVEKGNMHIEKYEKTLKKLINLDYKLIFLTNDEWTKNKKKYIENIKNNVKYTYVEEIQSISTQTEEIVQEICKKSELVEKANQLFDINKIEIKGE